MTKSNHKIIIAQKGNNILRRTAKDVPIENIKNVDIKNVIERLKQAIVENEEAVAAAAPQIGESLRIFAITDSIFAPKTVTSEPDFEVQSPTSKNKIDYGFTVFINPKIIKKSREQKIMVEGCLSAEGVYGTIKRAGKIKVEAYDESGKKFIKAGSGLFSQVIQHEIDHLDGVLFTDKALVIKKYEAPEK